MKAHRQNKKAERRCVLRRGCSLTTGQIVRRLRQQKAERNFRLRPLVLRRRSSPIHPKSGAPPSKRSFDPTCSLPQALSPPDWGPRCAKSELLPSACAAALLTLLRPSEEARGREANLQGESPNRTGGVKFRQGLPGLKADESGPPRKAQHARERANKYKPEPL